MREAFSAVIRSQISLLLEPLEFDNAATRLDQLEQKLLKFEQQFVSLIDEQAKNAMLPRVSDKANL